MAERLITFDEQTTGRIKRDVLNGERRPRTERAPAYEPLQLPVTTDNGIIFVKNATAAQRSKGEILALGAPIFDPDEAFKQMIAPMRHEVVINGVAIDLSATPDQMFRFCVLLEGIPSNSDGQALAIGVLPVKVNVTSTVHRYARPTTGDHTQLTSDWWGGAEIMQTVTDTGAQYLYCRLGNLTFRTYRGKTDASHAKSATGTVSVWSGVGGSKSDSGANIDSVYNPYAAVGSGKFVAVTWVDGGPELIAAEC